MQFFGLLLIGIAIAVVFFPGATIVFSLLVSLLAGIGGKILFLVAILIFLGAILA